MNNENEEKLYVINNFDGTCQHLRRIALLSFFNSFGGIPKGLKEDDFFNPKVFSETDMENKLPIEQVKYELKCNSELNDNKYIVSQENLDKINTNLVMYVYTTACNKLVDDGELEMIFDEKTNSIGYRQKIKKKKTRKKK